jgi:hypothetical protein
MPTTASCKVASGFVIASGDILNAVVAFAIAWRAQAVARGVIQAEKTIRWMQFFIALLVVSEQLPTLYDYGNAAWILNILYIVFPALTGRRSVCHHLQCSISTYPTYLLEAYPLHGQMLHRRTNHISGSTSPWLLLLK